ncbi:IS200/IS605 family transposase [Lacihabitans sp. CCS-44]|uniref:IS200/IS605 family transposase n=1 Tax=Lacihabitans sp. CCS-44 TaxID=2487331 RepID=UPI0020CB7701|nr:IS200/IS605 family transposase [Lacihabitans sp. CCS-44]MCP9753869.1 IS200/IS605 family transposase [Lacihabitans sp. CCS-44]
MGSFKQMYYQIVFGTKHQKSTISNDYCEELYKYIWGLISAKKCKLYRINGVEDHIHIFCDLHPSIALADLIKDIKVSSSIWMKSENKFPSFEGWQDGYGVFTYNNRDKQMIINYVKNQKEHHKTESFLDEYKRLLTENEIEFDEKYLL